jgi:hypothetical protein
VVELSQLGSQSVQDLVLCGALHAEHVQKFLLERVELLLTLVAGATLLLFLLAATS